jgi:hypothetical protein
LGWLWREAQVVPAAGLAEMREIIDRWRATVSARLEPRIRETSRLPDQHVVLETTCIDKLFAWQMARTGINAEPTDEESAIPQTPPHDDRG